MIWNDVRLVTAVLVLVSPVALTIAAAVMFLGVAERHHRTPDNRKPNAQVNSLFTVGVAGIFAIYLILAIVAPLDAWLGQWLGRPPLTEPLGTAIVLGATVLTTVAVRVLHRQTMALWSLIRIEYANVESWPTLRARGKRWTLVMQRQFVRSPEVIDAVFLALFRQFGSLGKLRRIAARDEYPVEFAHELDHRYWGLASGTVRHQMQKLLLDGVFGPRQLDSLRLTEYQVEKELKTALSCPSCSGMVAPSRRSAQCRSCLGNGVATVVCPECSGSPASPGCGRCSGAGRITEENPRLFMDRLQWYWFAYNRRRFVDLAIRIVFGRKIHLAICTGAGLVYAGLAFLSGAPGGALDLLAESLFLGAATVAGLVAVGVILILLLCLRGTATFDIPWPTPDPTLGLKLWRRCANLVITDATFLFVAYGFGFPFLLFEPEVVTTSASVTVLLSVVGGLTLFAVFAVLGLMIIHHAMQVARDSKLLELEDNMLERDETFRAALLPHYQALQALETWPIDRSMFAKLASSFAIPAITQAALLSWRAVSINAAP